MCVCGVRERFEESAEKIRPIFAGPSARRGAPEALSAPHGGGVGALQAAVEQLQRRGVGVVGQRPHLMRIERQTTERGEEMEQACEE